MRPGLLLVLLLALLFTGCGPEPRVALDTLVLRDSLYLAPGSLEPYTGGVFRVFADDPGQIELEGRLEEGTWSGELTVYHPGGRIRYQGRLASGAPCGAWVENREESDEGSLYDELVREIESMGLYPDCPD